MTKKDKKLWGKGPFNLNGVKTIAYVLDDGTPLLNKSRMFEAIGMQRKGISRSESPAFIGAMNLQSFIREELKQQLKGVEFYDGNVIKSAYPAEILASVCNVYLEARQAGVLTPSQEPIAQGCEILLMAFAKVGIRALIYEQLGFEKFKHPDAFRILIEGYMSEEIRKWSKEFPDELFIQMDRIYGNQKTTSRNRPMYYAKFIRKYIYEPIEKGEVLYELDSRTPKNDKGQKIKRLHQSLSEELGVPSLRAQIWQVIGILKTSPSKRQFESAYARLMGNSYQPGLFDDDI